MRTWFLSFISWWITLVITIAQYVSKPKQMKRLIEPCRHPALFLCLSGGKVLYSFLRHREFDFPRLRTFTIQLETLMSLLNMRKPFSRIHTMDAKHLAHVVCFAVLYMEVLKCSLRDYNTEKRTTLCTYSSCYIKTEHYFRRLFLNVIYE